MNTKNLKIKAPASFIGIGIFLFSCFAFAQDQIPNGAKICFLSTTTSSQNGNWSLTTTYSCDGTPSKELDPIANAQVNDFDAAQSGQIYKFIQNGMTLHGCDTQHTCILTR